MMELMPMHIKADPDCTKDEPAPADPAAAPVPAATTCYGILADRHGKTACTSKTAVTANVNKTGKMDMFKTMDKPFCQTCLTMYKRYAAHCTCVACAVLVASGSATYAGCPPVCLCVCCPSGCLSACLLSACLAVCLPVCRSVCLSVCLSACLCDCRSDSRSPCVHNMLSTCRHTIKAIQQPGDNKAAGRKNSCTRSTPCARCVHMLGTFRAPRCQMPECTQSLSVGSVTKFCDEHRQEVARTAGKRKRRTTSRVCQQCQASKAELARAQAKVARLQSELDARDAAAARLSERV